VIIPLADGYLDPRGDIESPAWIDIVSVNHSLVDYAASRPDGLAGPDELWIAYGLVFDTDLDGVADVRLGMDFVPAELTPWGGTPGDTDVRAWRTDLRAGTTEFGPTGSSRAPCDCLPPYHPSGGVATAHFHPHEAIPGRFYAWASVIQDGRVLATDYAPDTGWLDRSPASVPAGVQGPWIVTGYDNGSQALAQPASPETRPTAAFGADGTVEGFGGCNQFSGDYSGHEASIAISQLVSTRKVCDDATNAAEEQYFTALHAATTWTVSGEGFELRDDDGAILVSFKTAIGQ
jgi:hypothetical protein